MGGWKAKGIIVRLECGKKMTKRRLVSREGNDDLKAEGDKKAKRFLEG